MARSFMSGMTTGAIIGAAVGIMLMPEMDKDTKKKIKRIDSMILNAAGGIYNTMRKMNR